MDCISSSLLTLAASITASASTIVAWDASSSSSLEVVSLPAADDCTDSSRDDGILIRFEIGSSGFE